MAKNKPIILAGSPIFREGIASATITPGMLVEYGGTNDLQPHSAAGGNARKAVAVNMAEVGQDSETDYASGDQARYAILRSGDRATMLLANGENVSKGDPLESDGAGALQAHTPQAVDEGGSATYTVYSDAIVGYADEAINNTSGSAVRIEVEAA
jgi:hypothetical protein